MSIFSPTQQGPWRQMVTAIVLVVVLALAQIWIWNHVLSGAQTLHSHRTEQQQLQELAGRLVTIEQKHQDVGPLIDQLSVVFPRVENTSQVVDRLEQLADRQNISLDIKDISVDQRLVQKGNDRFVPTSVTLEIEGVAPSLLQYIDAVEHVQELATIRSWNMTFVSAPTPVPGTPVQSTTASAVYTVTMTIVFYLQQ